LSSTLTFKSVTNKQTDKQTDRQKNSTFLAALGMVIEDLEYVLAPLKRLGL